LIRAFLTEMQQRPVIILVFEAYTSELQKLYLLRNLNPADDSDEESDVPRIQTRMRSISRNLE
jgi:hypothetical protein